MREFIISALSPATVNEVYVDTNAQTAQVLVPENKLSLAIGKGGQNVKLAARLTGWKIDVKSESQVSGVNEVKEVDYELTSLDDTTFEGFEDIE